MSHVFDAYAAYYDLLYATKNYAGEARYVDRLIRRHAPNAQNLLELGCGTGAHARELGALGYAVTGIDQSNQMIEIAQRRGLDLKQLSFMRGDARTFRGGQPFDVVISLFHVMSYQISNTDLLAAMKTAASNLRPGGVFIFDCWHGPGVLTDPPTTRVLRLEKDGLKVTRIAEPVQYPSSNRVDVNYEIIVENDGNLQRIRETHSMRYMFIPEIDFMLEAAGLTRLSAHAWMTNDEPGLQTWNACFVAQR